MTAWISSLVRGRVLELAAALALGYGVARLADELVTVPVRVLAQHVGVDPFGGEVDVQSLYFTGVFLLNFDLGGTVIFYGDVLATALTFGLLALATLLVVRRRDRELGVCPFCASRIPHGSTHCAYCGSGIAPGEPA